MTEEQLNEIEAMAGLFFSPEDIALNLQFEPTQCDIFCISVEARNVSIPFVAAYYKGRLAAQVAMRAAIRQSAENGSNPAQQAMLKFMNESEI